MNIVIPELDAPPLALAHELVPEVADDLEAALAAVDAARKARARVVAAADPKPGFGGSGHPGSAVRAAMAEDVVAVREGRKPTGYGKLISSRPQLEGEALACESFAAELVAAFNATGHLRVEAKTRGRLAGEVDHLVTELLGAAAEALAGANGAAQQTDDGRLRRAWRPLTRMDELADRWRPRLAVLRWCSWDRPVRVGRAWEPLGESEWPDDDVVQDALALRDESLRYNRERMAAAARAR